MRNINLILSAIFILILSCKKDESLSPDTPFVGNWGGQGIAVLATETQVTLEFNCASGTINKKVMLNSGIFSEKGTFTQFSGNIPINTNFPDPKPVLYEGNVSGNNLSLTIKSEDGKTVLEKYNIVKNVTGNLVRCM
jgi:hypothetical protein